MLKRLIIAALFVAAGALIGSSPVAAQSCPAPAFAYGQVLTAAQWNQQFACKQAVLGYTPVNKAGDTMSGKLTLVQPSSITASLNMPQGITGPTSPVNGDMWITAAGLNMQVNGTSLGPFNTSIYTGASAPGAPNTYSFWNNTAGSTIPLNIYDGSQWVNIGTLNPSTHSWTASAGGSVTSFSAGSTGFTPSSATTGAITLAGTLNAANGGTGITSLSSGIPTFLGTSSSANLAAAVTDETGSGPLVFGTAPTITSAVLTTPAATGGTFSAPAITGGTAIGLTSLGLRNAGTGAFDLTLAQNGTMTAGRSLTFDLNDVSRTITLAGNINFNASVTKGGTGALTLTTTGASNVTLPTTGTLATLAGSETLTNKTFTSPAINTGTFVGGTVDNAVIGGTTRAAVNGTTGNFNGNLTTNVTGTVMNCLNANSSGVVSGTGASCGWTAQPRVIQNQQSLAGTSSGTGVMYGAAAVGVNPLVIVAPASGTIKLTMYGYMSQSSGAGPAQLWVYYGTGTPPANGAAQTGTRFSAQQLVCSMAVTSGFCPVAITEIVTGLTPGTTYWTDFSIAAGGGTNSLTTIKTILEGLPQ